MLGVTATLPDRDSARPPIILVHGAANSASIRYQFSPYPYPLPAGEGDA
jgi:hypothetical protein